MSRCVFALFAFLGSVTGAVAGDPTSIELTLQISPGSRCKPMEVIWIEKTNGRFVQTIKRFSKAKKWYKDLKVSYNLQKQNGETKMQLDAVTGATIAWGQSRTFSFPAVLNGRNLLDGRYVLRVESAQDPVPKKNEGKHYMFNILLKKDFRGGTFPHNGYVSSVRIRVLDANGQPVRAPVKKVAARKPAASRMSRAEKSAAGLLARARSAEKRNRVDTALRLFDSAARRYAATSSGKQAAERAAAIRADSTLMAKIRVQSDRKKLVRLLARARSWEANGMDGHALKDYRKLVQLAPASPEAAKATSRIQSLESAFGQ